MNTPDHPASPSSKERLELYLAKRRQEERKHREKMHRQMLDALKGTEETGQIPPYTWV